MQYSWWKFIKTWKRQSYSYSIMCWSSWTCSKALSQCWSWKESVKEIRKGSTWRDMNRWFTIMYELLRNQTNGRRQRHMEKDDTAKTSYKMMTHKYSGGWEVSFQGRGLMETLPTVKYRNINRNRCGLRQLLWPLDNSITASLWRWKLDTDRSVMGRFLSAMPWCHSKINGQRSVK